jgi:hypothetical protein
MADLSSLLRAAATAHQPSPLAPTLSPLSSSAVPSCPPAGPTKAKAYTPTRPSGPRSRLIWSDEQEEALATDSPRLLISALAGSGKTSVLLEYARRRPQRSWTLLTLNVTVAKTVAALAPPGLTVRTLHSLAFARYGAPLAHKLVPDMPSWAQMDRYVSLPWGDGRVLPASARAAYGKTIADGLLHFSHNADELLTFASCDAQAWVGLLDRYPDVSWDRAGWCADASSVWRALLDPRSPCPTSHNVYLKRFCLAADSWPRSHWLLDEAQDWPDGVRVAWDRNVDHGVRAGDPFQAIYTWRTEATCPWSLPGERSVWLHQSRRQGEAIAPWVNGRLFPLTSDHRWVGAASQQTHVDQSAETVDALKAARPDLVLSGHWSALSPMISLLRAAGLSPCWSSGAPASIRSAHPDVPVWEEDATPAAGSSSPVFPKSSVVLSTIHAAKGAERERVWIVDDALSSHERPDDLAMPHRLAYVALTRGRCFVRVPAAWPTWVSSASDESAEDPFAE